jgi:hypothetical protein
MIGALAMQLSYFGSCAKVQYPEGRFSVDSVIGV